MDQDKIDGVPESKVFVTQENSSFTYALAEEFGKLHYLTAREFAFNSNSKSNQLLVEEIKSGLIGFDSQTDYLLLSGSPVATGLSISYLLEEIAPSRSFNVLVWNRAERAYKTSRVVMPQEYDE